VTEYVEQLRREYNAAVANGYVLKARIIDRRLRSLERNDDDAHGTRHETS
jgi:hypothetical protein